VVRCLAECNEVLTLIRRENPYAELYADVVKRSGAILDSYPWLAERGRLRSGRSPAPGAPGGGQAVDEFDKVRRLQREAVQRVKDGPAPVRRALSGGARAPASGGWTIMCRTWPRCASCAAN
jgi:hypothetical protein